MIGEWLLRDLAAVTPGLRQSSLRYFNVVGSGPPELADHSPHNLFPKVFRALSRGEPPLVFGTDYDTPDGSCVRDYVHVVDLADAHVAVAKHLEAGRPAAPAYNVGRGQGSSVLEVVDARSAAITGYDIEPELRPAARRPGPDRGRRGPDRRRPGLARSLRPRRHGLERLGRVAAPARGPRRRRRQTARGWRSRAP